VTFDNVGDFALAAYRYCKATGGSVTSWGRTPKHNKAVKGVPNSYHITFKAVDVVYDKRPSLIDAESLAAAQGLRLIREKDHDHLQPA
jgi:hypothetical protein